MPVSNRRRAMRPLAAAAPGPALAGACADPLRRETDPWAQVIQRNAIERD